MKWDLVKSKILNKLQEVDTEKILNFIRKKWIVLLVAFLCIFLGLGFLVGKSQYSKSYVISKLETSLKNNNEELLCKIVKINGNKVDKKTLNPLMKYYIEDKSKVDLTINSLKNNNESNDFKLICKNKIFGKRYYLEIKTYNLEVNSNYKEGKFSISNNYENILSGGKFNKLIPGIYNIKGVLESDYGNIKSKAKEITIMSDKSVDIKFNAVNVTVSSIYDDAEIYIDNKDTNIEIKDNKKFGPFPTDGSISIFIKRKFPWGTICSNEVKVKDIPNISLDINMKNDELTSEVNDSIDEFYKSVFQSLNKNDEELIVNATDEAKESIFNTLSQSYIILKNKYTVDDLSIDEDKSEFSYKDGVYSANIVVCLKYNVSKAFFGLDKTEKKKNFFTKIIYKDNEWKVEDVDNFSL